MSKLIISLGVALLLIGGFNYWMATKEVHGDSCKGYDVTITTNFEGESTSETTTCTKCNYKINPKLITEGFDLRQRYVGGCKDYIERFPKDPEIIVYKMGNSCLEIIPWPYGGPGSPRGHSERFYDCDSEETRLNDSQSDNNKSEEEQ